MILDTDLAALARDRGTGSLDATLRAIGVIRPPELERDLTLLRLRRIYATRIARAMTGALALALTIVLDLVRYTRKGVEWEQFQLSTGSAAIVVVGLLCLAYWTGLRIANRSYERAVMSARDPIASARRNVAGVDRWFGVWIVGIAVLTTLLVSMYYTTGDQAWIGGSCCEPAYSLTQWCVAGATVLAMIAGVLITRRRRRWLRRHWLERPLLAIGVLVCLAVAFRCRVALTPPRERRAYEDDSLHFDRVTSESITIRAPLTIGSMVAAFCWLTALGLERRRREEAG